MPTTDTANKAVVAAYFEAFNSHDWSRLEALLTEDFRWETRAVDNLQSAQLANAPAPGRNNDRTETLSIYMQTVEFSVDKVFDLSYTSMTAEGDLVCVESSSTATSSITGRHYRNLYVQVFVVRDSRIAEIREYQDTLHAYDVWMAP